MTARYLNGLSGGMVISEPCWRELTAYWYLLFAPATPRGTPLVLKRLIRAHEGSWEFRRTLESRRKRCLPKDRKSSDFLKRNYLQTSSDNAPAAWHRQPLTSLTSDGSWDSIDRHRQSVSCSCCSGVSGQRFRFDRYHFAVTELNLLDLYLMMFTNEKSFRFLDSLPSHFSQ